ncbi:sigma-54-dependent transcriptional regulator [Desulfohalobium retbaense]|uniref:Two component, sigma54 specific, transcriptional regulator, Fis family n=1 Tax=Desulfohalobium retbaense (strain ATCC 49708 / DSM 5692 / JCM 16813 / HR100) TaxID=485915 RepID=C8WZA4_DESRD|nr:sigma-54 dependent transcriptional regulator [Desulfohalobium retbaense]ACV67379.1 two component, sigma54 specific, transcriptional regulator, Fis family [Desulfohalobium retbaense DSM 5692]
MATHILIIDDEKNYLLLLETMLAEEGYAVTTQQDPQLALDYLGESEVDVVITDMKMPHVSGQKVLEEVKKHSPHIPVLIMTAFGSIDGAVEAMKCGAFDYITKPFSNDELLLSVSKAGKLAQAERENRLLRQSLEDRFGVHQIIGRSKAIRDVLDMIGRVAASRSTVLLTGESGTGKELVARAVHFASDRAGGPFVPVNCMALNPGVLESELFGHEKGSFSGAVARRRGRFEMAHTGTLFLDEIGELSQETQVKLLRVLQERTFERVGGTTPVQVDIRLIAATNKDLAAAVSAGTFREDLYYRLNVVQIPLPALRERREDIPLLAAHFLKRYAEENNAEVTEFASDAIDYLTAFEWPGNVRQLENVVERCVVLARSSQISVNDLPPEVKDEESQFKSAVDLLPSKLNLGESLEKIEAALIRRALAKTNFIQVKAAEMLGISKSLLQYKLKKYNISGK